MTTATEARPAPSVPDIEPIYVSVKHFSELTAHSPAKIREYCRIRGEKAIPHAENGRKYLIELKPALLWLRRNRGKGYSKGDLR